MMKVPYKTSELFGSYDKLVHGHFGRTGGVSTKHLKGLNTAFSTGDKPQNVLRNRRKICHTLGIKLGSLFTPSLTQDTKGKVLVATLAKLKEFQENFPNAHYDGTQDLAKFPAAHAAVTNQPHVNLMISTADCSAVSVFDPVSEAVGLAHVGFANIGAQTIGNMISAMKEEFGSNPKDMRVALSPSLGVCCNRRAPNEVGQRNDPFWKNFIIENADGSLSIGLRSAAVAQLKEAGVPAQQIDNSAPCTACNTRSYYSYRAQNGQTGRQATIIGLRE